MEEVYLLDIVTNEGRKEIRTTKKYESRKALMEAYETIEKVIANKLYMHSKGKIYLLPKIFLVPKEEK